MFSYLRTLILFIDNIEKQRILDSEWTEECIGITIMLIFFILCTNIFLEILPQFSSWVTFLKGQV